jgi:hypothetical protein
MPQKRRNRKPPARRSKTRSTQACPLAAARRDTPENQARQICGGLLKTAAAQARRGEPRLIAEILAYLKPTPRPVYILPPGYADLAKPTV